jgi:hypothetical protein
MRKIINFKEDIQLINLTEARRNPELNPKISAYEALKPYKDNPNMYISFTKIDKIGINPKSYFNTPLGIYTYPLQVIWEEYQIDRKKTVGKAVPFAGENPFIWLVEKKPNSNFVDNMYTDYDSRDYDRDLKLLKVYARTSVSDWRWMEELFYGKHRRDPVGDEIIDYSFDKWTEEAKDRNAVMSMWNITRNLAIIRKDKKDLVEWNTILRKVLGYDGFADKSGKGYIHPSEPFQAVFLHKVAFKVVAEFLNKDYAEDQARVLPDWVKKSKVKDMISEIKNGKFIWKDGVWLSGTWEDGVWLSGTWEDGVWENGFWENGTWEDGTWENGFWQDGTWQDGTWKDGTWDDGIWDGGYWLGGHWRNGTWKGGGWVNGVWHNGTWEYGRWVTGEWEYGAWEDGVWENGFWEDGTWEDGIWISGDWRRGKWVKGLIYDPERKGDYQNSNVNSLTKDDDSFFGAIYEEHPEDYVYSGISPKEYFKGVKK